MNQPDRRTGTDRRAVGGDRTGEIDPILFGRLCVAHADAEESCLQFRGKTGEYEYDARDRMLIYATGKAEGLALAIAIISGGDLEEIRERAQQHCEDRRVQL